MGREGGRSLRKAPPLSAAGGQGSSLAPARELLLALAGELLLALFLELVPGPLRRRLPLLPHHLPDGAAAVEKRRLACLLDLQPLLPLQSQLSRSHLAAVAALLVLLLPPSHLTAEVRLQAF